MRHLILALAALATKASGRAWDPVGFEDGHDLQRYVSRPDLAAPRYQVTKHHPESIAPGYWFVAPYAGIISHAPYRGRREHTSYQIGAHVYDADGDLVWSGARKFGNRNVFGFKPITWRGATHLSLYVSGEDLGDELGRDPAVVILNDAYEEVARVNSGWFDLHEFNVLEGGQRALVTTNRWESHNATEVNQGDRVVVNPGFLEVEMNSGRIVYEWTALAGGVRVNESYDAVGMAVDSGPWDFAHVNAVDKFANGDYLVSGRHTSTIYRINGITGLITWRLGGYATDFATEDDDLEFAWQHHARIWSDNATHTLISVFDNHGEDEVRNPDIPERRSAVKFIMLNTKSMTAELVRQIQRPDGGISRKLGSVQLLDAQDNVEVATLLIDWGDEGYLSEHTAFDMVMEAKFVSDRMASYRGYKSPWVGRPKEAPALRILPVTTTDGVVAAFHTSWNGATEVASWSFYGCESEEGLCAYLGNASKSGFETSFIARYLVPYGYVEAYDVHGTLMQPSALAMVGATAVSSLGEDADASSTIVASPQSEAQEEVVSTQEGNTVTSVHHVTSSRHIGVWSIVVDVFAGYGVVALARTLIPMADRWRHGYRRLEVHD